MTDEIHDQLPSSGGGGGAKYAVIGLLMLLAIGGIWYATKPKEPEAPAAQPAQAESPKAKAAPMSEAPPASPPPPSKTHAEQDKELLGSFGAELDAVLDEDEDD